MRILPSCLSLSLSLPNRDSASPIHWTRTLSLPFPLLCISRFFSSFLLNFNLRSVLGDLLSSNRDLDLNGAQFSARAVVIGRRGRGEGRGHGSRDVMSTSASKSSGGWEKSAREIKESECRIADLRARLTRYCSARVWITVHPEESISVSHGI